MARRGLPRQSLLIAQAGKADKPAVCVCYLGPGDISEGRNVVPITEDAGFVLDIRYATADNLTGAPLYRRPAALLQPAAYRLLRAAAARAAALGLRMKVFDAFRPIEAQWALWRALPDPRFVADPAAGSALHPRGVAVDLTLMDGTVELDCAVPPTYGMGDVRDGSDVGDGSV